MRSAVNLEHVNLQVQGSKWLRMSLICYVFTVTCTTNTQAFAKRLHKHFLIVDTLNLQKFLQHFAAALSVGFDYLKK